jgi:hypothetical protein
MHAGNSLITQIADLKDQLYEAHQQSASLGVKAEYYEKCSDAVNAEVVMIRSEKVLLLLYYVNIIVLMSFEYSHFNQITYYCRSSIPGELLTHHCSWCLLSRRH